MGQDTSVRQQQDQFEAVLCVPANHASNFNVNVKEGEPFLRGSNGKKNLLVVPYGKHLNPFCAGHWEESEVSSLSACIHEDDFSAQTQAYYFMIMFSSKQTLSTMEP